MPKLIDYAARFDQIREAVFDITLRDGPEAISLAAVAEQIPLSLSTLHRVLRSADDLPRLGFQWAERQQRKHLLTRLSREILTAGPVLRAADVLINLVPGSETMADEHRVWHLLVDAHARSAEWAGEARAERHLALDRAAQVLVDGLELSDDESAHEYELIRALVEGATTLVIDGRMAPEEASALVGRHLTALLEAHPQQGAA